MAEPEGFGQEGSLNFDDTQNVTSVLIPRSSLGQTENPQHHWANVNWGRLRAISLTWKENAHSAGSEIFV